MSDVTIDGWSCPLPLRDHPNVVMGHGGGGKLSAELVEHLFVPAFGASSPDASSDAAVVAGGDRIVVSTDTFVVRPRFFPGGNIGELAVNGTINDVAMRGARPLYLSVAFILEEGLPMSELGLIAESMGAAAEGAGVRIVTGDTKVVDRGHGDGVYINTTGIGVLDEGVDIGPDRVEAGDAVIVSGTIGDHGMAIMSVREGLEFEAAIESDTAPLHGLVAALLDAGVDVHALRDPTRGGLASSLNEIAVTAGVGVVVEELALPVERAVQSACEMLGLDPFYVANEGKLVAFVPADHAGVALGVMRSHPLGANAVIIGECVPNHPGMVVARTAIGSTRVVDTQIGEQLPRIC
ncbi:MAG: hydrogenase expression/formation protein HypE [Acidimicrobiia bacterium]|nr:hydrogenase expression/formation protein HypE [Acidimicrobiia bacterium]NNF65747.1 hydrogenase expression/formation protein HypE [Acidimicrobiia bacterium]